jgi:hypothetical protein
MLLREVMGTFIVVASLAGCTEPASSTTKQAAPAAPVAPDEPRATANRPSPTPARTRVSASGEAWPDPAVVTVMWPAPGRVVACAISEVVENDAGLLVRVVSLAEVPTSGSTIGQSQNVSEVDVQSANVVGGALGARVTHVMPRPGLTWADVESEQDVTLATEPSP